MVKAETKQHVTGSPSPYSCDLSPTLERVRRTGKEKRWIKRGKCGGERQNMNELKWRGRENKD